MNTATKMARELEQAYEEARTHNDCFAGFAIASAQHSYLQGNYVQMRAWVQKARDYAEQNDWGHEAYALAECFGMEVA